MRRIFIIAAAAVVLVIGISAGFAGWYFYGRIPKVPVTTLEEFVPQDAFYYVSSRHLADKVDAINASPVWGKVQATGLYSRTLLGLVEQYREKYAFMRYLLTEENALAVFMDGDVLHLSGMFDASDGTRPSFLFLARVPQGNAQLLKTSLAGAFLPVAQSGKASRSSYRRIPVTSYDISGKDITVYYALVSGILVLSNDFGLLCRSIDCAVDRDTGGEGNLAGHPDFVSLSGQLDKDALLWGYANTRRSYEEMLKNQAVAVSSSSGSRGVDALAALEDSQAFAELVRVLRGTAFSVAYDEFKTALLFRSVTAFNREHDEQGLLDVLAPAAKVEPSALPLIPHSCLLSCLWAQDAKKAWRYYLKSIGSFEKTARVQVSPGVAFQDAVDRLSSALGVGIEDDVLPRLGETFGMALEGFEEVEISPPAQKRVPADPIRPGAGMEYAGPKQKIAIPQVYFFAKVTDAPNTFEKARVTLNHLIGKLNDEQLKHVQPGDIASGLDLQQESLFSMGDSEYAGTRISSVRATAPWDFLSPSLFTVGDQYLVVAASRLIAERVIDRYRSASAHPEPPEYSSFMKVDAEAVLGTLTSGPDWPAQKENIQRQTRGAWTIADVESVITMLSSIKRVEVTAKSLSLDTVETVCTLTVEGL